MNSFVCFLTIVVIKSPPFFSIHLFNYHIQIDGSAYAVGILRGLTSALTLVADQYQDCIYL